MSTIKRFEDLECWKEARQLVQLIYCYTEKGKFKSDFELKNQIKRSVVSGMANIAEGFHRNSNKDFLRFLDYSRSSIAETISHCYVAFDQNYINDAEMKKIKEQSNHVWKEINSFIAYLNDNLKQKK